jgi:hypothetical protein
MAYRSTVLQIVLPGPKSQRGIFPTQGIAYLPGDALGNFRLSGLQVNELAVGWSLVLHGFPSIFVQWRSEGA